MLVPPLFWLVLSLASLAGAVGVWQSQRLERMRPPTVAPATALDPAAQRDTSTDEATAGSAAASAPPSRSGAPAVTAPLVGVAESSRPLDPTAGRQVLRCTSKGRVTYRDLNAGCPEGAAEKVTVYPTEGVGKPR